MAYANRNAMSAAGAIGAANRPSVTIELLHHFSTKVYTTGDAISGQAIVNTHKNVAFDKFEISFLGMAHTRLDFVQQFPTQTSRTFMKLRMPISTADLPGDKVFKSGKTYKVPFHFVVPHQLTINACNHKCVNEGVRDQHLRLPPSVGGWQGDDQAPEMAQVCYSIIARASKQQAGKNQTKLFDTSKKVKVLPARPEDPPMDITSSDKRYSLSKSKLVRKNMFSAKTGELAVSASQPGALMLSKDGLRMSESSIGFDLVFTPSNADMAPPKISSVSAKLNALTFFSAAPTDHLPNLGPKDKQNGTPSLHYTTTTNLFNKSTSVDWVQEAPNSGRRDSGYSSLGDAPLSSEEELEEGALKTRTSSAKAKKAQSCNIKYTSALSIPFLIPTSNKKFFVPTFHSCIVSRTYTLVLTISTSANTNISLNVPVQIGVEGLDDSQDRGDQLPSFESVMMQDEQLEVDAYLTPRVFRVGTGERMGESALPGYDDFRTPRLSVPA